MAAYPVTGFAPPLLLGTVVTVNSPVAPGYKLSAAENTPFPVVDTAHDLGAQFPVIREHGGLEVAAHQRIGYSLRTNAAISIIQQEAVAPVIIGTQSANQRSDLPGLGAVHAAQLTHC